MIHALILAAGASQRMGTQKLLLPYDGVPLLRRVYRQLYEAGMVHSHVVTGHDHETLQELIDDDTVSFTRNTDYEQGMLSSIRCGLKALPENCSGALIALGDHPQIHVPVIQDLLEASWTEVDKIIAPIHDGRRGHPLIIPRRCWQDLYTRYDDMGLRGLLREESDNIFTIDAPSSIHEDMDTPEDYQRALEKLNAEGSDAQ